MNAVDAAKQVAALIPAKPRGRLFGVNRRDQAAAEHYHAAMMAAAVAAWQYAASIAMIHASYCAPSDWIVDHDNFAMILGMRDLRDLEAMCDPNYAWPGRRRDQL